MAPTGSDERFVSRVGVARLYLFVFSLIAALGLAETGLRILKKEDANYRTLLGRTKVMQAFPGVDYVYPAHANYSQRWPDNPRRYFDAETNGLSYRVNNYGFRDDDFSLKRNRSLRIAFLGDSFCWGLGVRKEDSFEARIENRLNQTRPFGQTYEIYNFGLPGYSTANEAALYSRVVRYFQPDLLLVWYHLNDFEDPEHRFIDRSAKRRLLGRSAPKEGFWGLRLIDLVRAPSRRAEAERTLFASIRKAYRPGHPGLAEVEGALRLIGEVGRETATPCGLVIFPWLYRLSEGDYPFGQVHERVKGLAEAEGFLVLDLFSAFVGSKARDLWVHPRDQHPNDLGHAIAAEAGSVFLEAQIVEAGELLLEAAAGRRATSSVATLPVVPNTGWYEP